MFNAGSNYRVFLERGGKVVFMEGRYISRDPMLLSLDIEGVRTIFSLSTILYVEEVDLAAEEARSKARSDAYIASVS